MLLHNYNKSWPINFNSIAEILEKGIFPLKVSILHVGSTAVPHLSAKPIIDIDVVYVHEASFSQIKSILITLGYYHNGNQGIVGREVFKRKLFVTHQVLDNIKHHLYVCSSNSLEYKKHLFFRDFLRNDEAAKKQYEILKQSLATEANQNKKTYALLKEQKASAFVNAILDKGNF